MARNSLRDLTKIEWDLMNEVWREGEATVAAVHARFVDQRGWSHNTVKTMLQRLVKKGYLEQDDSRKAHVYRPLVPRHRAVGPTLKDFLDRVLDEGFGPLVAYAAERKNLTDEEIGQLRRILEEGEENDVRNR